MKSHLTLSILISLATPAMAAEDRLADILARGTVRIATTGDYQPFSYKNPVTHEYEGLDIDLGRQLARELGVKLEWVPTSWPQLMADYEAGKFDIVMSGVSINLERQKKALFSIPYLKDGKTPITRCTDAQRFQTLAQIDQPGVNVIVNPGGTNEKFARSHLHHARLTVYPDNTTIFEQIASGKADVMMTDAIETRLQAKLRPALCAIHPNQPFTYSEKALLLPNDFRWKAWVDQFLHQAQARGTLDRLQTRWLSWPWLTQAPQNDLDTLLALMNERLKLMPDVARYKWNEQSAIEDLAREKTILADLVKQAEAAKVSPSLATAFFKAQIEAAKMVQHQLTDSWRQQQASRFEDIPDLKTEIRPRLDALTSQLIDALARNQTTLADPARQPLIESTAQRWIPQTQWGEAAKTASAPLLNPRP
ncbi:chorismate mutase-like protein [Chitinivorax tropicus]|uniref:chorismate mutase n=1 Tax=Chitinivorax tropicus TaxID=714531 RepID=A0A840MP32_9PROT|nr:gamma subclass chorismate mutase AroQ [Chitinivorax tropicus]MBB5018767.1 chorismate mutase-like protein [Chitinivorax tropicus]